MLFLFMLSCSVVLVDVRRLGGIGFASFFAVDCLLRKPERVWCVIQTPERIMFVQLERVWLLSSTYWTHPLIWVPMRLFRTVLFGGMIFWFFDIPNLLRSAGFNGPCLPSLLFCLKELIMLVVDQGAVGTWILIPWWWSIHSPYLNSNCYL